MAVGDRFRGKIESTRNKIEKNQGKIEVILKVIDSTIDEQRKEVIFVWIRRNDTKGEND